MKKTQSSILYIHILTISQHAEEVSQKIMYSEWQKKRMGEKFRVEMNRQKAGETPDEKFEWQREFHLLISPLNSHNHAIGEVSECHHCAVCDCLLLFNDCLHSIAD